MWNLNKLPSISMRICLHVCNSTCRRRREQENRDAPSLDEYLEENLNQLICWYLLTTMSIAWITWLLLVGRNDCSLLSLQVTIIMAYINILLMHSNQKRDAQSHRRKRSYAILLIWFARWRSYAVEQQKQKKSKLSQHLHWTENFVMNELNGMA